MWAEDMEYIQMPGDDVGEIQYRRMRIDLNKYQPNVEYEARYFLNNSYTTFKKSKPFSVK